MRKKTGALTLLEVVIALVLAGALLSALMSFFYQMSRKNIEVRDLKKNVLPVELMRQRLIHLFGSLGSEGGDLVEKFYTISHPDATGSALLFTYDYGADPDPAFCGPVTGMLYLNKRHQLCLSTWGEHEAVRQEVFLEGIGTLSFQFFHQKEKKWNAYWSKKDPLPSLFQLAWSYVGEPKNVIQCAFILPESDARVVYPKTKMIP